MKSLLIIYSFVLVLGIYTWKHSEAVLNSVEFEHTAYLSPSLDDVDLSYGLQGEGHSTQLQPAINVQ